ncbi:hypothetical protein ABVT39_023782 [Epinephelus coioides]
MVQVERSKHPQDPQDPQDPQAPKQMVQVEYCKQPQDPQAPTDVIPTAPPLPAPPPPYPQDTSPSETGQYPLRSVGEARAATTTEGQVEGRFTVSLTRDTKAKSRRKKALPTRRTLTMQMPPCAGAETEADLGEDQQAKEDGEGDRTLFQDHSHRNSKPISNPHPISNQAPRK